MNRGIIRDKGAKTLSILIISVLLFSFLSLYFVLASSIENTKSYNPTTTTVTIKNNDIEISKIKLNTPIIYNVIRGKDRLVAEFTIENLNDYSGAFDNLEFYDVRDNMKKFDRDFTYKYKTYYNIEVPNYETICKERDVWNEVNQTYDKEKYDCYENQIGSHLEKRFNWIDFDEKEGLSKGNITLGIFTDVLPNEHIEWVPTLFDIRIDEWAEWTESLNVDLWAYYTFNVSSGNELADANGNTSRNGTLVGIDNEDWTTGLIGNALYFDGSDAYVNMTSDPFGGYSENFTIGWWEYRNATGSGNPGWGYTTGKIPNPIQMYDNPPYCTGADADGAEPWESWPTLCGPPTNPLQWSFWVVMREGNNWTIWKNGTVYDSETITITPWDSPYNFAFGRAQNSYIQGLIDEVGIWHRSLNQTEITQLYNNGNGITYEPLIEDTTPPETTIPILNSTDGSNKSNQDLNCYATLTDDLQTSLTAYWKWYKNNVSYLSGSTSVINGTDNLISALDSGNISKGENWICEIKPFDGVNNGTAKNSSSITILNSPPTHIPPTLTTPYNKNLSTQNLTCTNKSTSDADNDVITNIYNWYKNNQSILSLNLPFEGGSNSTNTKDYSSNENNGIVNGANWNSAGDKIGGAYEFDGIDDNVTIPDSSTLDFTDKKTWQLWFKRAGTGAEILFNKGNETETNYKLEFLDNDKLKFSYSIIPGELNDSWIIDDKPDFDLGGTYNQTIYNETSNAVMLSNYIGDYKSKVFDYSEKILSFNTISFSAYVPEFEELSAENGMVGLWHFNENSGTTAYDETTNNNDGTVNGATWISEGKFNSALDFDGSGDYVNTSTTNFPTGNSDITIEAWFKIDDLNSDNGIVTYGYGNGHNAIQLFHRTSDDKLVLHYWGGYGAATTSLSDNNWHHAVAVHANNTNYLYLDGQLKASTAYANANIVNSFNNIGRVPGYASYDFDGIMDEVAIYNKSLSSSEISEHYEKGIGIGAVTNLSLSVRSCEENDCSDMDDNWNISDITNATTDISSLPDNKYFQFKAELETNNTNYSPELYSVTINYSSQITEQEVNITSKSAITDNKWYLATITFEKVNGNDFRFYLDNELETQKPENSFPQYKDNNLIIGQSFNGSIDEFRIYNEVLRKEQVINDYNLNYNKIVSEQTSGGDNWMCQITPNDGEEDGITLNSSGLEVYWAISFNATSGEDGSQITSLDNIVCNNSWSSGSVSSPFEFGFEPGNYECIFVKTFPIEYYDKSISFTANNDKTINVIMSEHAYLTLEEHTWLEAIYECIINKNCDMYNLLLEINNTVGNIWEHTKPTDENVITFENITNKVVDSTHNLTIDYSVNIPIKAGYVTGTYLPVRIGYWFLDTTNTTCYNQGDKPTGVEDPYCQPLIIETLGPMGGSLNFTVKLHPSLPAGNYSIKRIIDIDPNNVWINYGQEVIGSFTMLESLNNYDIAVEKTGEKNPSTNTNNQQQSSQQSSSSGNSDSNSNKESSVTNVYNTYVTNGNNKSSSEENNEQDKQSEKNKSAGITGGAIKDLLTGGNIVISLGILAGLFAVSIICRTIIKLKKK